MLTTKVFRHTDQQPLAGYKVRYRVLDGPPALFVNNRSTEFEAVSDLSGHAVARLVQQAPAQGVNRIGMEIIRPARPDRAQRGRRRHRQGGDDGRMAGPLRGHDPHRAADRQSGSGSAVHHRRW